MIQGSVWAQGGAFKLDVQRGVEKEIENDCAYKVLDAFLRAGNKPVEHIAGFRLKQVYCSFDTAMLVYKKADYELKVSLKDDNAFVISGGQGGVAAQAGRENSLAEIQVQMQKANLKLHEDNIHAFEELKSKFPALAERQEKKTPPSVKYTLPVGETLYFRRQPCEDKCGVVEADALIGGRFYFKLHAEHDAASLSQKAAEGLVAEVVQTIKWEKLR